MSAATTPDSTLPSPSQQQQRVPSLFSPSQQQLSRLRKLLRLDEAALGQVLAAAMAFGLPIGPPRPAPGRQLAQQARSLHRLAESLADLVQEDAPAWQALLEQCASQPPSAPLSALVRTMSPGALAELSASASALASAQPRGRGRPADPAERERMLVLMRELARIAEGAGMTVGRLAPAFSELVAIVFDLAYVTRTSPDSAIRYLLDERSAAARQGGRRITFR